jgi:hypothetical protein
LASFRRIFAGVKGQLFINLFGKKTLESLDRQNRHIEGFYSQQLRLTFENFLSRHSRRPNVKLLMAQKESFSCEHI